jgi:hypothetical protein
VFLVVGDLDDAAALDYLGSGVFLETELQATPFNAIGQAGTALSSRRALEDAEKHFERVMELYRLSRSSVSELSDASALVSSSQGQLIKAQYGFPRSLSTLRTFGAFEDEAVLTRILTGD